MYKWIGIGEIGEVDQSARSPPLFSILFQIQPARGSTAHREFLPMVRETSC